MSRSQSAANANLIRSKMQGFDWSTADCREQRFEWGIYLCDHLEYGMVYVEIDGQADEHGVTSRIAVCTELWVTLSYSPVAVDKLLEDMRLGGAGMKFIVQDAGAYAEAARIRADSRPKGAITSSKDPITELAEEANGLVIQAASLNRTPSDLQTMAFSLRYTQMRQRHADLLAQLESVGTALDLAGTALWAHGSA